MARVITRFEVEPKSFVACESITAKACTRFIGPQLCPLPDYSREVFAVTDPIVRDAMDPILLEHRDRVYREHLELPVDID